MRHASLLYNECCTKSTRNIIRCISGQVGQWRQTTIARVKCWALFGGRAAEWLFRCLNFAVPKPTISLHPATASNPQPVLGGVYHDYRLENEAASLWTHVLFS